MRNILLATMVVAITTFALAPAHAGVDAAATLDQLKALEGTWTGTPEGKGEAEQEAQETQAIVHEFKTSANGTVVIETMNPGTDHEMINMYHMDGEDLVLTHYCAGGNQPKMRLDREASSADTLVFDFDGGTNLDPAQDHYIHSARIQFLGDGRLDSTWYSHAAGEPAGEMAFHLSRPAE